MCVFANVTVEFVTLETSKFDMKEPKNGTEYSYFYTD